MNARRSKADPTSPGRVASEADNPAPKVSTASDPDASASATYRTRLRARMLQIAERILEEEGLEGVQARRIAKEADCSVGTIYNVFDGLEGLIIAANSNTLRGFGRSAELAVRHVRDGSFEDKLLALALAYLDFASDHGRRLKAVFEFQLPERDGLPQQPYEDIQGRLFALIEQAIAAHVPEAADRARIARAMFAAVHGVVLMAIDRKLGPFDMGETEKQVRFVVEAMARGLALTTAGKTS